MGPSAAYQQPPRYAPPQPAGYTPPPAFAPAAPVQAPSAQAYGAPAPAPAAQQTGGASPSAALPAKMLRGFLVSYQTTPGGDFWALHTGRATVGRSNSGESLDIPLADATISSRHAVINVDAAMIQVEDTGSTNGTFVNDEHVGFNGRRELKDGDRVRFGGFTTIVKIVVRPLS
jgi:pSer/pThr/pTyr-binding forkhead associated (FHA) protein